MLDCSCMDCVVLKSCQFILCTHLRALFCIFCSVLVLDLEVIESVRGE